VPPVVKQRSTAPGVAPPTKPLHFPYLNLLRAGEKGGGGAYLNLEGVPVDPQTSVDHAGPVGCDERGEHVKVVGQADLEDELDTRLHVQALLQGVVAGAPPVRPQQLDPPQTCAVGQESAVQ